nr:ribonuclease H-like domain-containing protein [Tanacetum cinerariifolium]
MAIPEYQLAKFHKMIDAKEMLEAIKSRFSVSIADANQKFLRSLPSSWSQVYLIMRTKPGVDTLGFDDLYNNLRVFESDVKGSNASSSNTQNVVFVSSNSTNSTNEVAMISTRQKKFYKKTGRNLHFDSKEPVGFDKSKVECFSCHNTRHFARECRSKGNQESRRRDAGNTGYKARDNAKRPAKQDEHKAMVTINGECVDWTGHAKDDTKDYALMAFNFSNLGSDTEMSAKDKSGLGYGSQIHEGVLSYENEVFEIVFDSQSSDVEDSPVNDRFAKVEGMHAVSPPVIGNYMPPKFDFRIDESNVDTLESMPEQIKSKPKVVSEPKVWYDAPIIEEYKSDSDDEYVFKASVEQEKPSCAFMNTVKHDNPHQTLKGKGIIDNGCSRHMTGNKTYLVDYQDFNGGPVAFGGSKGQITGKGKIKTRKLDFEDVYFVKELQHFNLFSMSQMCDKKNKVLFIDTECLVLSPDFKLPNENQVLLRVHRQNTMYSFNLENIVPSGGLACLIAKDIIDEFNKWHRRLKKTKKRTKIGSKPDKNGKRVEAGKV